MGALRKKIGLKFSSVLVNYFFIVLFVCIAIMIQYAIFRNLVRPDIMSFLQYIVYIFIALSLLMLLYHTIKSKMNTPIAIYENGIYLKRTKQSIMYNEIANFYFMPNSENKINKLIIEKINKDKFTFDTSYVGQDFMEFFQKDYNRIHLEQTIDKIEHGYDLVFGLMSSKQKTLYNIVQTKGMAKNLNYSDKMTLTKDGIIYNNGNYLWSDISLIHDIQSGKIEIVDKLKGDNIIETYVPYVEKGEFPFAIIDYFVDKNRNKISQNPLQENSGNIQINSQPVEKNAYIETDIINDEKI